jgi:glycosyltransferase involved in cell wall biosynthesis
VLPTLSENFGVVVPEALSQGVPVITTTAAPWSDLVRYRCGWWVEPTEDHLSLALKEATQVDPIDLAEMGRRGIEYARRYNWETIAEQMIQLYEYLLNRQKTDLPDFLSSD